MADEDIIDNNAVRAALAQSAAEDAARDEQLSAQQLAEGAVRRQQEEEDKARSRAEFAEGMGAILQGVASGIQQVQNADRELDAQLEQNRRAYDTSALNTQTQNMQSVNQSCISRLMNRRDFPVRDYNTAQIQCRNEAGGSSSGSIQQPQGGGVSSQTGSSQPNFGGIANANTGARYQPSSRGTGNSFSNANNTDADNTYVPSGNRNSATPQYHEYCEYKFPVAEWAKRTALGDPYFEKLELEPEGFSHRVDFYSDSCQLKHLREPTGGAAYSETWWDEDGSMSRQIEVANDRANKPNQGVTVIYQKDYN